MWKTRIALLSGLLALECALPRPTTGAPAKPAPSSGPPAGPSAPAAPLRPAEEQAAFFEARVRPLLAKHCYGCHGGKTAQGGLRLDSREALLRGGVGGPVLVPGKPGESRLVTAVRYADPHLQMPPSGKLGEREIELLTAWVERGAVWPAEVSSPKSLVSSRGDQRPETRDQKPAQPHWAFRPLGRSEPPLVKRRAWVRRRIDGYVLARLEAAGQAPSPAADRRTLVRRAAFDLLGLPPTPEEIEAFVKDPAPDAYERLVERLLASPHYGERWGRHWLDLARYCDVPEAWAQTEGQAWLYRDWVVRALNADLPYDQFVKRQLAADELPGTPPAELAALGFLGLSPTYWKELKLAPDVIKTVVAEEWEERINTVTGTVLGLTVACARCHDHKFDPVSTQDYYALAGVFASTRQATRPLLPPEQAAQVLTARAKVKELEAEAKRLKESAARETARAAELARQAEDALARAEALKRATPHYDEPMAYTVETASLEVGPDGPDRTRLDYRMGAGQDVTLQIRGNPAKPGPVVPRRFLAVLSRGEPARFTQGSGRRELADALFRDAAPLAARVMVNRVWKHHFGRGLVETPSNFGLQGDRPSHPELLDDLAARFIQSGWSLKWLHREIMLSAAYQQGRSGVQVFGRSGVRAFPGPQAKDPENRLVGRMERRRLEVEAWRDALLSAAGVLDLRLGGPPEELSSAKHVRRTLYGTVTRRDLDDLLRLYDFPDPTAHSPARFHTTTPLQQLFLLNSGFTGRIAGALSARLRAEVPNDLAGQVRRAYLLLYGRPPRAGELASARRYLEVAGTELPGEDEWKQYLEVLLAGNELMYVD